MNLSDIIATIGVSILLVAFFLQIIKVIHGDSLWYVLLNFLGAALAGYASWLIHFYPFVILETVWASVSLFGIFKVLKKGMFHVKR